MTEKAQREKTHRRNKGATKTSKGKQRNRNKKQKSKARKARTKAHKPRRDRASRDKVMWSKLQLDIGTKLTNAKNLQFLDRNVSKMSI